MTQFFFNFTPRLHFITSGRPPEVDITASAVNVFTFDFRFFILPLKPDDTIFLQFHPRLHFITSGRPPEVDITASAVNVFTFDFRLSIFDFF